MKNIIKIHKLIVGGIIFSMALIFLFTIINPVVASAASTCSYGQAENDRNFTYDTKSDGTAYIQNRADCDMPMTLMVYKMFDASISTQTIYSHQSAVIPAHSSMTLRASLPNCKAQIDLFYGLNQVPATTQEVDYAFSGGNYCTNSTPTPPPTPTPRPKPALNVSCSANPSSVNVGDSVSWSATASGGNGSYTYSWSGTDGLSGSSSYLSKTYSTAGTKAGTITVTSGKKTVSKNCSVVVNQVINNDLTVSCSASPSNVDLNENVIWRANPAGGTGSYTYSWSGTNSLSGNSQNISKSYNTQGTKTGTVTVTSGGFSASASCTARVNEEIVYNDLHVSCYASPSSAQVGNTVRWYVNVSGGDGNYDYDWEGTNNLNSSSRNPAITYNTPGNKEATVTVTDGDGQEESADCYANINQNSVLAFSQVNQTPLAGAVYLSQIPYTGFADNMKLYFFILGLALFSAYVSYVVISYNKGY